MATLTIQQLAPTGTVVTPVAAGAGGDVFPPGDHTTLKVVNGSGSSINVTIDSAVPCNYGFDHDNVVAVAAGATKDLGPFPAARYANLTDGLVHVSYSAVTTVTVAAVAA